MSSVQNPASATVITASGTSQRYQVPSVICATMGVLVNATAVSGTSPSLTVTVEWSDDGTNFVAANPADTFSAITAVGGAAQAVTIKAPYYRLRYAVSGTTPSFTLTAAVSFP